MAADPNKVANVLDLMAEYVDQVEREKQSAVDGERNVRLDKIAAAHLAAHGEELSDVARQKLAKTDSGTLDIVQNLLNKQAGTMDALGAPADAETQIPRTTKEAATAADENFLNWIVS